MPQYLPEFYEGYIYIDGQLAPKGTNITIEVDNTGEIVGGTTIINDIGYYMVLVIFDNDVNPKDEGAENGERLIWYVNNEKTTLPKPSSDIAESGKENRNFNVILSTKSVENDKEEEVKSAEENAKQMSFLYLTIGIIVGILLARIKK